MSRYTLARRLCPLCSYGQGIAPGPRPDPANLRVAVAQRSFSTSSAKERGPAQSARQKSLAVGGGSASSRGRSNPSKFGDAGPARRPHGRPPPKEAASAFNLSSNVPVAGSEVLDGSDKPEMLKLLRRKANELGRAGGQMAAVLDAVAARLGLDNAEFHRLAQKWSETAPFAIEKDLQSASKISFDGFDSLGAIADFQANGERAVERAVLSYFLRWIRDQAERGKERIGPQMASVIEALDLRYPGEWYPSARSLKRKLILHVGPTNSGKTYNALCALAKARAGAFAGPLRLLATEVYNRFNAGTIGGLTPDSPRVCNLITGEEKKIHDNLAGLESCTVEMMSTTRTFDVVVIDEIQMIGNADRGQAWTNALIGIRASEVHLCGEPSVVDLVKRIGRSLGDDVEVRHYERLSPLRVAQKSLRGDLTQIKKGDCLVTFSRNNIFALKKEVEEVTGLRVAVAYGGLPPEVREEQARGFNASSEDGGYDVMVASDAIGMGLNLKIKRIIFETMHKWDGRQAVELSTPQIKQIGGRAGRFSVGAGTTSASGPDEIDPEEAQRAAATVPLEDVTNGVVTCLEEEDMPILHKAMKAPMEPITKAALHPTSQQLTDFTALLPSTTTQAHVFEIFPVIASTSSDYFIPAFGGAMAVSDFLKDIPHLSVGERWLLGNAPVNVRDPEVVRAFVAYASGWASHTVVEITQWLEESGMGFLLEQFRHAEKEASEGTSSPLGSTRTVARFASSTNLIRLESLHRCLSLYLWLHYRASIIFPQVAEARLLKVEVQEAIDFILEQMTFRRKSVKDQAATKPKTKPAGRKGEFGSDRAVPKEASASL